MIKLPTTERRATRFPVAVGIPPNPGVQYSQTNDDSVDTVRDAPQFLHLGFFMADPVVRGLAVLTTKADEKPEEPEQ